jgi:putative membrane protein
MNQASLSQKAPTTLINLLSIVVPIVVAVLLSMPNKVALGEWTKVLPHAIGAINSLTSLLLIAGIIAIKGKRIQLHRWSMLSAFSLGAMFLVCYVTYHLSNPSTKYGGTGWLRGMYLTLLLSHIVLSILVLPFVLRALYFGLTQRWEEHRRVAKTAFPVWLFVSISGVLVYWMISPYYGQASDDEEEYAGTARVANPYGDDPGQRKLIADMQKQKEEFTEEQMLRSFTLTERSGNTIDSRDLKGQPFVASFFYSTCPGSCKQQNDQMRLLQQKYRDASIRLVSISVDPENDTPKVLEDYANGYGADRNKWLFLTGDIQYISRVASDVFFLGQIGAKSHPDRFCLFDAEAKLVGKYNWHDAEQLKQLDQHISELLKK